MRYKLELVGQKADVTVHAAVGTEECDNVKLFRVQRLAPSGDYAPSIELKNAFDNASDELRAVYSKVVAQRD